MTAAARCNWFGCGWYVEAPDLDRLAPLMLKHLQETHALTAPIEEMPMLDKRGRGVFYVVIDEGRP